MALSLNDEIARQLYSKIVHPVSRSFEEIPRPAYLLQLLSIQDIMELNKICTSKRLSAKPKEKFAMINSIMARRGFKKLAAGTNRIAYKYTEDQSFVVKVAFAKTALTDNIREYANQQLLKPFVTKVFEVSPCGTVGLFERVNPISSREQFISIAPDIYDIIINHLLGKYVIDDIGSQYFMNWGVRTGSFPVLLDFPFVYELDGSKLYCNCPEPMSKFGFCGGEIDYDDGFNFLVCKKCGKKYLASDLKVTGGKKSNPSIIVERKGDIDMNIQIINTETDTIVSSVNTEKETLVYEKTRSGKPQGFGLAKRERERTPHMKISIKPVSSNEEVVQPQEIQTSAIPSAFVDPNIIPKVVDKTGQANYPKYVKDNIKKSFSPVIEEVNDNQEECEMPMEDTVVDENVILDSDGYENNAEDDADPVTSQEAWDEIYNRENDLGDATEEDESSDEECDSGDIDASEEDDEDYDSESEEDNSDIDTSRNQIQMDPEMAEKLKAAKKLVAFNSDDDLGDEY